MWLKMTFVVTLKNITMDGWKVGTSPTITTGSKEAQSHFNHTQGCVVNNPNPNPNPNTREDPHPKHAADCGITD